MRKTPIIACIGFILLCAACVFGALMLPGCSKETAGSRDKVEVATCDGQGKAVVARDAEGQALADALMAQWKRDHPERNWVEAEKEAHEIKPPADNSALLQGGQADGHTYGQHTERDLLVWGRETEKFILEGSRIFHSAELLRSEVAVSCDMCHPHAANTHPETYPKFQVQLGRVALLRDMIHWCIDNPVRGGELDPDDPRMRALEAYIMAQRSGTAMDYGKH
ncbi:MAG: c-type cytochrome [Planctomycetota bacterium]|jgi:cytochrome c